jgi:hypothetical protein
VAMDEVVDEVVDIEATEKKSVPAIYKESVC